MLLSVLLQATAAAVGVSKLGATMKSGATTAVMGIPTFYIYSIMEIGLILAALRVIEKYIKILIGRMGKGGK